MRSLLDWLGCTAVKAASWAFCRLSPEAAVWVGQGLGGLAYLAQPKRARLGVLNLRAAFDGQFTPREGRRIIRACYRQFGASLVELLRLPVMGRAYLDRYLRIEGRRIFEDAVTSGRPVILLTGHYGNWEFSSIAAALLGYPITALARMQAKFPRLYRLLVSYRESKGCTIIHKGGAMRRLIAALELRKPVGIIGDQASRQGMFVEFFGRPAQFATGPFKLARHRRALIVPAFIHRVRGPFHRIVVEPPLEVSWDLPEEEALREAIGRFAHLLAQHITQDPHQWLWMHNRWKRTPARRVLVLSDGKAGHLKQSLAVVEAMRERSGHVMHRVVEIRYRSGVARALALLWSRIAPGALGAEACLSRCLMPSCAVELLKRSADCLVSCGSSVAPVNLLWARAHRAKSVVIMNPTPLPLSRFSLVIAPYHDGLAPRPNLVSIAGAIARMPEEALRRAGEGLRAHPKFRPPALPGQPRPAIAVFVGGDTAEFRLGEAFVESLMSQVLAACEAVDGWCVVTSSRRTSPGVERLLAQKLSRHPRCRLLLLAGQDPLDGTLEGMLGLADVAVVTGESVSMVSEACASGRRVVAVEPPLREGYRGPTAKHLRFLQQLKAQGYVHLHPLPEVGHGIRRALAERQAPKRLDDFSVVREAVVKLL